jgi:hypothetical protein
MKTIYFIIIITIFAILCGFLYLSYIDYLNDIAAGTNISEYDKYNIKTTDNNDTNYSKLIESKIIASKTIASEMIGKYFPSNGALLAEEYNLTIDGQNDTLLAEEYNLTIDGQNDTLLAEEYNQTIDDQKLIDLTNDIYGSSLPWDKELGYCNIVTTPDIVKENNIDSDLYSDNRDSNTITFYDMF